MVGFPEMLEMQDDASLRQTNFAFKAGG